MENLAKDAVAVLQYLLPGFLAAWVFYGFTSYPKPSEFERVVQALIFSLLVQLAVLIEEIVVLNIGSLISLGSWTKQSELLCSTVSALLIGVIFAYYANNDKVHKWAREKGLTNESSFPLISEWYVAFLENITYVVLHFEDGRRLYGWPKEWPSKPDKGHFVIVQASWLDDEGNEVPVKGTSSIMINVKDVRWVEFMEKVQEAPNE